MCHTHTYLLSDFKNNKIKTNSQQIVCLWAMAWIVDYLQTLDSYESHICYENEPVKFVKSTKMGNCILYWNGMGFLLKMNDLLQK